MSTFTKEQLIARINQVTAINKYRIGRDPAADGLAMDNELLAIALASLEAEAVGEVVLGEYDDCGCHPDARVVCIAADGQADWENFKDGTRLYAAPPSLAAIDERAAFNTWNNDENLPIAGVGAKNAAWLAWQARSKLTAPPAPVSVPTFDEWLEIRGNKPLGWVKDAMRESYDACRAAMLHSFGNSEQLNSPGAKDVLCPCCGRKPLKNKTCSVAGCDDKHVARGLCAKHYAIARKKDPSRRESIRAADKRYRARKAAAPQQEVK